jgi:hypothetical protein
MKYTHTQILGESLSDVGEKLEDLEDKETVSSFISTDAVTSKREKSNELKNEINVLNSLIQKGDAIISG